MIKRTALITGASSGIGYEIAKIFASQGYNVLLVARSEEKLKQIARDMEETYNVEVRYFPLDITKIENISHLHDILKRNHIQIDFLVNNPGIGGYGKFNSTDWVRDFEIINLNIVAMTYFTKLFIGDMVARKHGKILNIASVASFFPGPYMAVYFASNAYTLSLSEAIASEIEGSSITITTFCTSIKDINIIDNTKIEKESTSHRPGISSTEKVALAGYRAMMIGKKVSVYGIVNKLAIFCTRFLPRSFNANLVRYFMYKGK